MKPTLVLVALVALGLAAAGCGSTKQAESTPGGTNGAANKGPVLASGVAPVTGGTVVATVMPDLQKVGQRGRLIQVATAPIDASGNFVLRPDPSSGPLSSAIVKAIAGNNSWVNLDLSEMGADRKMAVTSITRQYVDASGKPVSLAEFRATPGSGHWVGDTGGTTVDPKYEVVIHR